MSSSASTLRRLNSFLIDSLPVIGLLLLWLGIVAAGWIGLGGSRPASNNKTSPSTPAVTSAPSQPSPEQPQFKPADGGADTGSKPETQDKTSATRRSATAQAGQKTAKPSQRSDPSSKNPRSVSARSAAETSPRAETQDKTGAAGRSKTPTATRATPEPSRQKANHRSSSSSKQKTVSSEHIARAQFTSGVENNEPVDRIGSVFHSRGQSLRRLYYFTDLRGLAGETVSYRWRHEGRVLAKVSFRVGANQFRAYSSKRLTQNLTGRWTVTVTDSAGQTLTTASVVYAAP